MQNFLEKVLEDLKKNEVSFENLTFILPSKRAGVFLKNHFKSQQKQVQLLPQIISLEDFIAEVSGLETIDSTALLFELYTVYKAQSTTQIESFDKFSKWASILLQDFNEIHRHLVDAQELFAYLSDVKRIEQLLQDQSITPLIFNQLKFYEQMPGLFEALNNRLLAKKMAYQGLQYYRAANAIQAYSEQRTQQYVFAGFNALNKAEEVIFETLNKAKKAFFYWDVDQFFLDHNHNAARFIKTYMHRFKHGDHPSWVSQDFSKTKQIQLLGIPNKIGQVKQVATILAQTKEAEVAYQHTALVLADETLLSPTLNALPAQVKQVNITMGYDIANLPLASFFQLLFNMHLQSKDNRYYFKSVIDILNYAQQFSLINATSIAEATQQIKNKNKIYLSPQDFIDLHPDLKALAFLLQPWHNNCQQCLQCLLKFTALIPYEKATILQKEARQKLIAVLQALLNLNERYGYMDSIKVLFHYYQQLLSNEKLSFKGEPLSGLQLMGMLETRALDFETVIITSVNENILPAGKSANSFIPFDIKRKYQIPTYVEKNAIFSYHFFRLLQRAKNIYLLYNTEADDFGSGEQSRFLTQLAYFKKDEVNRQLISPKVYPNPILPKIIEKDAFTLAALSHKAQKGWSPSALTSYLRNPLDFYKRYVLGIFESDKVEEFVAANTMGTIIHNSLEALYQPYLNQLLTVAVLQDIEQQADRVIEGFFQNEYASGSFTTGKNLLIFHVSKQFVHQFLQYEKGQLQQGHTIKLLALEQTVDIPYSLETLDVKMRLKGNIDRVDEFDGCLRIIDYKTGLVQQNDLKLSRWEELIDGDAKSKVFQVLYYAMVFCEMHGIDVDQTPLVSGIISFKRLKSGFMSVNNSVLTNHDLSNFKTQLNQLLQEIFNPKLHFEEIIQKEKSYS